MVFEKTSEEENLRATGQTRVAKLLGVSEEELSTALTERVIAARGEIMQKSHTLQQAEYAKDALAKVGINYFYFIINFTKNINSYI